VAPKRDEARIGHNRRVTERPESLISGRLLLAFSCTLLVVGITNTFPVFFPPLLAEFGGSRAATASTITLIWLGGALLGPVAGWAVTRWDPRAIVILGLLAATLGFGLGALARSLPMFTLAVGVGAGIGVGLTGMVAQAALLADVYVRRRGVAMGIAFSGAMAGYGLAPPCQWAITHFGWRAALGGYVVLVSALIPLAWVVLPARLRAAGSPASGRPGGEGRTVRGVIRSAPFWLLLVVLTMPPLFGGLATTQHTLYLTERGFSADQASVLLGIGGVLAASGRVLFGLMADRVGAPTAGFVSLGFTFLGLVCLLGLEAWPLPLLAYGYALFLFLPMGSRATIGSVLVGRIAPPAHYGLVFGLLGIGNSLGSALAPLLAGALHDWTGSYALIYACAIGLLAVTVAALVTFCLIARGSPA
jgi:predicted MFS family arabinose efflux permease